MIRLLLLLMMVVPGVIHAQKKALSDYDISWNTPGVNSQGSMPLGNGDIGLNVWVDGSGDILFYVSKTDAWSENGQLLKLGLVRISLHPNPYNPKLFLHKLVLESGEINIILGSTHIKLWVDANNPTIEVDIDSETPIHAIVTFETWRKQRYEVKGLGTSALYGVVEMDKNKNFLTPVFSEPDTTLPYFNNRILSCHHNRYSQWKDNLELQALGDFAATSNDPLLNRTFGIMMEGEGLVPASDTTLITTKAVQKLQLNLFALTQTGTVSAWKETMLNHSASINAIPQSKRVAAHHAWWKQFWNRNYIFITAKDSKASLQATTVTRGYILQRFINACGGRGNSPIKFNGSIFTVDTYNRTGANAGLNADFRAWGGPYWWQNTRLPYWTMLIAGDFDMMAPLFKMYMKALPLRKIATKQYYLHDGAFFPETMNFWGTYTNGNYGINRGKLADGYTTNTYIRYYWQGGLELSLMMLDYYAFTKSKKFARDTLVPFVSEILLFFDQHWQRGADGKILFSPAMSLETYHLVENPLPEIVGIRKVAEKMLTLPAKYTSKSSRDAWRKLINDLPAVPVRIDSNDTVLAPAATFGNKQNIENPELYGVFPYRVYNVGKSNLDVAKRTFAARLHKDNMGWQQNSIQAAYLGLTREAQRMVVESFSTWDENFRFPAFWGPNYDWTPDQDHGCVAMNALQRMLVQYEDNGVNLLPAWPDEWDVEFKFSGPEKTIIQGSYKSGKMIDLKISPKNKIDLILHQ